MSKYYLGKKVNGKWVPVSEDLCDTNIMSVINFTSGFFSNTSLKMYLREYKKLDVSMDDDIAYIIKKKDGYSKIYNGEHICYLFIKDLTNGNGILAKLKEEKYNLELFAYLANNLTNKFKNNLKVEELSRIKEVVREVNYAHQIGIENYEITTDKRNLNSLISSFVRSSIVKKVNGEYAISLVNGEKKYQTDERSLADLVLLLNIYYSIKENEKNISNTTTNDVILNDDEKEEYLTEEEITAMGYSENDINKLKRHK